MGVVLKGLIETEAGIQKAILQYGAITEGVSMFRMNVMGIPIHGQPGKYRPAAEKGIADIYVQLMVWGVPVSCWLEVKAKKGRQQASQKEFEQRVENYYVVRSVDDAAAAIDDVRKKTTDKFAVFSTALNSLKEDQ
tara:strand:- start:42 stop:449 length:408 start_codon:yes stop_codon:yes gene_type:complete